jgi:hypothetical protein
MNHLPPSTLKIGSFRIFSKIRRDIHTSKCTTGISDTGGKFATNTAGVVDTGGKFATGVNDTGAKFASVNDTSGKEWEQYQCAADFSLLNLPKRKSLGRSKPATNS